MLYLPHPTKKRNCWKIIYCQFTAAACAVCAIWKSVFLCCFQVTKSNILNTLKPQMQKHNIPITQVAKATFRNSIYCLWVNRVQSSTATWWVEVTPEISTWTGTFQTWMRSCITMRRPTDETTTCRCRTTGSNRSVLLDKYTGHTQDPIYCIYLSSL